MNFTFIITIFYTSSTRFTKYLLVHLFTGVGRICALSTGTMSTTSKPLLTEASLIIPTKIFSITQKYSTSLVLPRPPGLVTENVIGLCYQGKHLPCIQGLVGVWMELLGHVEICQLDLCQFCILGHTKYSVIVRSFLLQMPGLLAENRIRKTYVQTEVCQDLEELIFLCQHKSLILQF